jgi:hypothetical protein
MTRGKGNYMPDGVEVVVNPVPLQWLFALVGKHDRYRHQEHAKGNKLFSADATKMAAERTSIGIRCVEVPN